MRMKVAKYISEFFVKQGVTDMFMITGGAAMHLNDAFGHQEGLKITYNSSRTGLYNCCRRLYKTDRKDCSCMCNWWSWRN